MSKTASKKKKAMNYIIFAKPDDTYGTMDFEETLEEAIEFAKVKKEQMNVPGRVCVVDSDYNLMWGEMLREFEERETEAIGATAREPAGVTYENKKE